MCRLVEISHPDARPPKQPISIGWTTCLAAICRDDGLKVLVSKVMMAILTCKCELSLMATPLNVVLPTTLVTGDVL